MITILWLNAHDYVMNLEEISNKERREENNIFVRYYSLEYFDSKKVNKNLLAELMLSIQLRFI